jgi:Hsp70 protein
MAHTSPRNPAPEVTAGSAGASQPLSPAHGVRAGDRSGDDIHGGGGVTATLGDALTSLDGTDPVVRSGMLRLRDDCIAAKEALSDDSETVIPVLLPGVQTQVRLTHPEFEAMIRPVLRETVAMLQRALEIAGLRASELSAVVLAGGVRDRRRQL